MDIKVSNINFFGKKEVLYGLTKAARNIHSCSLYQHPRLMMHGENRGIIKYETAASAYLDMVTKDESFVDAIKNFNKSDLKEIADNLKPIEVQHFKIEPLKDFCDMFEYIMNVNGTNNQEKINAFKILLEKLSA